MKRVKKWYVQTFKTVCVRLQSRRVCCHRRNVFGNFELFFFLFDFALFFFSFGFNNCPNNVGLCLTRVRFCVQSNAFFLPSATLH